MTSLFPLSFWCLLFHIKCIDGTSPKFGISYLVAVAMMSFGAANPRVSAVCEFRTGLHLTEEGLGT